MKILVLSSTPWSNDNSFGNTFSNIFEGIDDIEVANISCRPGKPTSYLVKRYFQITEKALIKNIFNKSFPTGTEIKTDDKEIDSSFSENIKAREFGRKNRWQILFWVRDIIWKIGCWKSQELIDFIDDYKPDVLFMPIYFSSYLNDILLFIKKHTDVPMIGYISDDNYTLKQFSLSPFYWLERLYKRRKVKKSVNKCDLLYVISDVQKEEYEKIFNPPCKILTKCADFSDNRKPDFKEPDEVLKIVYAGNISSGRYEILSELAKSIEGINSNGKKFQMDIYTLTPLKEKQKNVLSTDSVHLHPPVSYDEIREIQKNSDILLHCEGFSLKEKLAVHQSFSTKIVDYLETNRCILAIGDDYCASIKYFIDNNCGAVATSKKEIKPCLMKLCSNHDLLKQYADNAWESGKKKHSHINIKQMVKDDLVFLTK
ncbi:MAG: hypothetical protein IJA80_09070 [Clostridia bacterium]|nr:hypothetical protein [Clostridia bacterium]